MHEMSIAQDMMRIVEEQRGAHGFERVRTIRIRAGALSNIVPEALRFAFEAIRGGTCAEGAELEIDREPLRLTCRQCGHITPAERGPKGCESCGSTDVHIEGSTEFEIVSLEVDE
jgi:hydrogenase nickel incorporation protein HypA/HybF